MEFLVSEPYARGGNLVLCKKRIDVGTRVLVSSTYVETIQFWLPFSVWRVFISQ